MLKTTDKFVQSRLLGSHVALGSVTPAIVRDLAESGHLAVDRVVGTEVGDVRDLGVARQQVAAALRSGGGLQQPLVWISTPGWSTLEQLTSGDARAFRDLSHSHLAILDLLADGTAGSSFADLELPVFIFPPLESPVEAAVRAWVERSVPQQSSGEEVLTAKFLSRCTPEIVSSFEQAFSHVPLRSRRVTSTRQIQTALRAALPTADREGTDSDELAKFIAEFWCALCVVRPEIAPNEFANRIKLRETSLATSAIGIGIHLSVAIELWRRHAVWTPAAKSDLLASPLRRDVAVGPSMDRVKRFLRDLPASPSGGQSPIPPEETLPYRRLIEELTETGWRLNPAPPFDLVRGEMGLTISERRSAMPDEVGVSEYEASLSAAADIYLRLHDEIDFFDIDAPWWLLGRCISFTERSGTVRLRQAKSIAAKRWAGELATRLLPPPATAPSNHTS